MPEEGTETPCQGESRSFPFLTSAAKSPRRTPAPSPSPAACIAPAHRCQRFSHPRAGSISGQGFTLLPIQAEIGNAEPRCSLNWGEWIFLPGCQRLLPQSLSPCPTLMPQPGRKQTLSNLLSAGGRCTQWRLRSRRLLKKFGCLGDRSELPAEVASTGVGPAESRDQAQTVLWPGKEGEVEDKREVTANVSQSRGFPLHPVPEQQNKKANPQEYRRGDRREKFQRGAPKSQCPSLQGNSELSVEELNETIFKDHCYCVLSEAPLVCCTLRPCPLREHDYCGNHKDGVWALKDHDYCHVQGIRSQGRVNKIVHLTGKARAVLRRLAARKSRIGRIVRKARRILWHYRPWVNKRLEFPESLFSTSEPPVLPAQAEDDPTKGTRGAFCSPAKREAASPQPRSEGSSQGTMAEAFCVPVVSSELVAAPPPSNAATEVKREATRPEASVRCEAQRAQLKLLQSPDAKQNDEGHEAVNSDYVSLHDAYKMVMRTVDQHAGLRLPELRARRLLAA